MGRRKTVSMLTTVQQGRNNRQLKSHHFLRKRKSPDLRQKKYKSSILSISIVNDTEHDNSSPQLPLHIVSDQQVNKEGDLEEGIKTLEESKDPELIPKTQKDDIKVDSIRNVKIKQETQEQQAPDTRKSRRRYNIQSTYSNQSDQNNLLNGSPPKNICAAVQFQNNQEEYCIKDVDQKNNSVNIMLHTEVECCPTKGAEVEDQSITVGKTQRQLDENKDNCNDHCATKLIVLTQSVDEKSHIPKVRQNSTVKEGRMQNCKLRNNTFINGTELKTTETTHISGSDLKGSVNENLNPQINVKHTTLEEEDDSICNRRSTFPQPQCNTVDIFPNTLQSYPKVSKRGRPRKDLQKKHFLLKTNLGNNLQQARIQLNRTFNLRSDILLEGREQRGNIILVNKSQDQHENLNPHINVKHTTLEKEGDSVCNRRSTPPEPQCNTVDRFANTLQSHSKVSKRGRPRKNLQNKHFLLKTNLGNNLQQASIQLKGTFNLGSDILLKGKEQGDNIIHVNKSQDQHENLNPQNNVKHTTLEEEGDSVCNTRSTLPKPQCNTVDIIANTLQSHPKVSKSGRPRKNCITKLQNKHFLRKTTRRKNLQQVSSQLQRTFNLGSDILLEGKEQRDNSMHVNESQDHHENLNPQINVKHTTLEEEGDTVCNRRSTLPQPQCNTVDRFANTLQSHPKVSKRGRPRKDLQKKHFLLKANLGNNLQQASIQLSRTFNLGSDILLEGKEQRDNSMHVNESQDHHENLNPQINVKHTTLEEEGDSVCNTRSTLPKPQCNTVDIIANTLQSHPKVSKSGRPRKNCITKLQNKHFLRKTTRRKNLQQVSSQLQRTFNLGSDILLEGKEQRDNSMHVNESQDHHENLNPQINVKHTTLEEEGDSVCNRRSTLPQPQCNTVDRFANTLQSHPKVSKRGRPRKDLQKKHFLLKANLGNNLQQASIQLSRTFNLGSDILLEGKEQRDNSMHVNESQDHHENLNPQINVKHTTLEEEGDSVCNRRSTLPQPQCNTVDRFANTLQSHPKVSKRGRPRKDLQKKHFLLKANLGNNLQQASIQLSRTFNLGSDILLEGKEQRDNIILVNKSQDQHENLNPQINVKHTTLEEEGDSVCNTRSALPQPQCNTVDRFANTLQSHLKVSKRGRPRKNLQNKHFLLKTNLGNNLQQASIQLNRTFNLGSDILLEGKEQRDNIILVNKSQDHHENLNPQINVKHTTLEEEGDSVRNRRSTLPQPQCNTVDGFANTLQSHPKVSKRGRPRKNLQNKHFLLKTNLGNNLQQAGIQLNRTFNLGSDILLEGKEQRDNIIHVNKSQDQHENLNPQINVKHTTLEEEGDSVCNRRSTPPQPQCNTVDKFANTLQSHPKVSKRGRPRKDLQKRHFLLKTNLESNSQQASIQLNRTFNLRSDILLEGREQKDNIIQVTKSQDQHENLNPQINVKHTTLEEEGDSVCNRRSTPPQPQCNTVDKFANTLQSHPKVSKRGRPRKNLQNKHFLLKTSLGNNLQQAGIQLNRTFNLGSDILLEGKEQRNNIIHVNKSQDQHENLNPQINVKHTTLEEEGDSVCNRRSTPPQPQCNTVDKFANTLQSHPKVSKRGRPRKDLQKRHFLLKTNLESNSQQASIQLNRTFNLRSDILLEGREQKDNIIQVTKSQDQHENLNPQINVKHTTLEEEGDSVCNRRSTPPQPQCNTVDKFANTLQSHPKVSKRGRPRKNLQNKHILLKTNLGNNLQQANIPLNGTLNLGSDILLEGKEQRDNIIHVNESQDQQEKSGKKHPVCQTCELERTIETDIISVPEILVTAKNSISEDRHVITNAQNAILDENIGCKDCECRKKGRQLLSPATLEIQSILSAVTVNEEFRNDRYNISAKKCVINELQQPTCKNRGRKRKVKEQVTTISNSRKLNKQTSISQSAIAKDVIFNMLDSNLGKKIMKQENEPRSIDSISSDYKPGVSEATNTSQQHQLKPKNVIVDFQIPTNCGDVIVGKSGPNQVNVATVMKQCKKKLGQRNKNTLNGNEASTVASEHAKPTSQESHEILTMDIGRKRKKIPHMLQRCTEMEAQIALFDPKSERLCRVNEIHENHTDKNNTEYIDLNKDLNKYHLKEVRIKLTRLEDLPLIYLLAFLNKKKYNKYMARPKKRTLKAKLNNKAPVDHRWTNKYATENNSQQISKYNENGATRTTGNRNSDEMKNKQIIKTDSANENRTQRLVSQQLSLMLHSNKTITPLQQVPDEIFDVEESISIAAEYGCEDQDHTKWISDNIASGNYYNNTSKTDFNHTLMEEYFTQSDEEIGSALMHPLEENTLISIDKPLSNLRDTKHNEYGQEKFDYENGQYICNNDLEEKENSPQKSDDNDMNLSQTGPFKDKHLPNSGTSSEDDAITTILSDPCCQINNSRNRNQRKEGLQSSSTEIELLRTANINEILGLNQIESQLSNVVLKQPLTVTNAGNNCSKTFNCVNQSYGNEKATGNSEILYSGCCANSDPENSMDNYISLRVNNTTAEEGICIRTTQNRSNQHFLTLRDSVNKLKEKNNNQEKKQEDEDENEDEVEDEDQDQHQDQDENEDQEQYQDQGHDQDENENQDQDQDQDENEDQDQNEDEDEEGDDESIETEGEETTRKAGEEEAVNRKGKKMVRKWHCNLCNEKFALIRNYFRHKYYSHDDETSVHICDNCAKVITSVTMVNIHVCSNVTSWTCKRCNVKFPNSVSLMQHNKRFHFETMGPHKCNLCRLEFLTKYMLEKHRAMQHPIGIDNNVSKRLLSLNESRHSNLASSSSYMVNQKEKLVLYARKENDRLNATMSMTKLSLTNVFLVPNVNELQQNQTKDLGITVSLSDSKQEFGCELCTLMHLSKSEIEVHLLEEHNICIRFCELCGDFYVLTKAINHLIDRHIVFDNGVLKNAQSFDQGDTNSQEIAQDPNISYELLKILGEKRSQCLEQYRQLFKNRRSNYFFCETCLEEYLSIDGYVFHQLTTHDKNCLLCNVEFNNSGEAVYHKIKTHKSIASYLWAIKKMISTIETTENYSRILDRIVFRLNKVQLNENDFENAELVSPEDTTQWNNKLLYLYSKIEELRDECHLGAEESIVKDIPSLQLRDRNDDVGNITLGDVNTGHILQLTQSNNTLSCHEEIPIIVLTENDLEIYKDDIKALSSRMHTSCNIFSEDYYTQLLVAYMRHTRSGKDTSK